MLRNVQIDWHTLKDLPHSEDTAASGLSAILKPVFALSSLQLKRKLIYCAKILLLKKLSVSISGEWYEKWNNKTCCSYILFYLSFKVVCLSCVASRDWSQNNFQNTYHLPALWCWDPVLLHPAWYRLVSALWRCLWSALLWHGSSAGSQQLIDSEETLYATGRQNILTSSVLALGVNRSFTCFQ